MVLCPLNVQWAVGYVYALDYLILSAASRQLILCKFGFRSYSIPLGQYAT